MDWLNWLDKEDKYSGMTPKQRKIQESIDSENDSDNQYYDSKNASWESWLEKGRWDDEKKEQTKRDAKNLLDSIRNYKPPKKTQGQKRGRGRQAAERDEAISGDKFPAKKRVPLTRVQGHMRNPVTVGDTMAGDHQALDTKEGENSPTHDQYLKRTGRSDHQLRSGRKEQYITTDNAQKWKSWLEKNNAIETSHIDDEKKEEWDGKFSSSTTRDDAEDDDDKAISEEESLEELTDGKLEEVEKLKSWQVFLVNKMPMNQYDKSPQKVGDEKGMKSEPLTETTPVSNPRGSLGNKKVKRLDHEAGDGSRKIVEIPKEDNTNPEVLHKKGGRPETGGKGSQGSVNATTGGKGNVTQTNTNAILYQSLAETEKEKEPENITDDVSIISNNDSNPATPAVAETAMQKRQRLVRLTQRKYNKKAWESWLNKYEETVEDKKLAIELDEGRAVAAGKVPTSKVKPNSGKTAKMGEFSSIQAEKLTSATISPLDSWAIWLEKMQGAGDARFGNQHLTGLDQEPVNNEEDEANILPAKDENEEENDEKQEETNGKPYKALDEK